MLCIIERYMDIKLLNKYIAGDVLPEEKKEVIRWMKESEEHREQLMQLHRIYNATLWNGNVDGQNTKNTEKKKPVMRYLWTSMKIAAVVAMLAFIIHKEYQGYRLAVGWCCCSFCYSSFCHYATICQWWCS